MAAMDVEVILKEVVSAAKAKLNACILSVNADKSDDLSLKPVDDDAYCVQSLNDKVQTYDPFVNVYLDDTVSVPSGPYVAKTHSIFVTVFFADSGENIDPWRRWFRYQRALEETYSQYFAGIKSGFKVRVESLVPISIKLLNSEDETRVVGVKLTIGIA